MTNGSRGSHAAKNEEAPVPDNSTWDAPAPATDTNTPSWDSAVVDSSSQETGWEHVSPSEAIQPSSKETVQPSSKPDGTRSWASMFSKPKPKPAPAQHKARTAPTSEPLAEISGIPANPPEAEIIGLPPPPVTQNPDIPNTPPISELASSEHAADLTPSKDELTETNVGQVLDASAPPPSATAASTIASTVDPHSGTPLQGLQQPPAARPALGGYATSAYKATGISAPGRSVSYQRKIAEQQEAVVMPGKHAVDRAAVQFGSMGLNGGTEEVDVDSDREDAETRAQPPQHSPIAPRAALPPAPQQQTFPGQNDSLPTPKQAPGLPPPTQPTGQAISGEPSAPHQATQPGYPFGNQYGSRYGPPSGQQEVSAPAQKPYEPFGQQMQQPQQYEGFPSTSQAQAQPNHGAFSSATNESSSPYASDNQRNAYQNYFGTYGQQPQPSTQEQGSSQRGSTFGASAAEQPTQYPTNQAQAPANRFGQPTEAQNSGHSTPNPSLPHHQQPGQPHQMAQQHGQGQHGGYPYGNHPYYMSPYYNSYTNQVSSHPYGRERPMFDDVRRYDDQYLTQSPQFGGYGGSQGGYGAPFAGAGGKQGMYGHQGYGMSPQTSYDQHSASPANTGAFGQQHSTSGRDSTATGGLSSYGRSGSAQPSDNPQQSSHSTVPDVFSRASSNYPSQNSGLGSHMGNNDDRYGDSSKGPGGPSPSLGQPGARPGSAANALPQTGLPTSQGQNQSQQGYSGYMGHQMHGQQSSQYGAGPGNLNGHHQYGGQNHQAGGYGGYGSGYGGSSYGNSNRGGWGASYGH